MAEVPTTKIDMGKSCEKCGTKGAGKSGLCLKCAGEKVVNGIKNTKNHFIDGKPVERQEKITIKHELTDDERKEYSSKIAELVQDASDLDAQKKAVAADFKAQIEAKTLELESIARKIRDGFEMRPELCDVIYDAVNLQVKWYRADTGELVKSRKMTADEQQQKLF